MATIPFPSHSAWMRPALDYLHANGYWYWEVNFPLIIGYLDAHGTLTGATELVEPTDIDAANALLLPR